MKDEIIREQQLWAAAGCVIYHWSAWFSCWWLWKTVELQSAEGREGPAENRAPALNNFLFKGDLVNWLMILMFQTRVTVCGKSQEWQGALKRSDNEPATEGKNVWARMRVSKIGCEKWMERIQLASIVVQLDGYNRDRYSHISISPISVILMFDHFKVAQCKALK